MRIPVSISRVVVRVVVAAVVVAVVAGLAFVPPAAAQGPERRYKVVRAEEDWSFLESSPPATPDAFDAVKHVRLSDAWTFGFGGSFRFRAEADDGKTLGMGELTDTQLRLRANLHWELRWKKAFRWFSEVRHADTFATDRKVPPLMEDDPDVAAFFLEGTFGSAGTTPVTIRGGRQDLLFGAQRLVSPLDWSNVRRQWDGVTITARTKRTATAVVATRPVVHEEHEIDDSSDDVSFSGVHSTFRPKEGRAFDAYGWLLHDSSRPAGDVDRFTWGARWEWAHGSWSGDAEGAFQTGSFVKDDIAAGMLSAQAGHQWKKGPGKPRVSFGLDWASGDGDPGDGDAGTFDPMFPLGHAYLGHADIVGRKNIRAARVQAELWPAAGWKIESALHRFVLDDERDALYEAGNAPLRQDATGAAGDDVGWEIDVLATKSFGIHHSFGVEVARFFTGDFLETMGPADDFWWGWMGYELKF